jgi:hypothetical protein
MKAEFVYRPRAALSLLVAVSAIAAIALVATQGAAPQPLQGECRGTLILERVTVVQDTDPNEFWSRIDQWTYHIYSWQNGVLASAQNYKYSGDTGYSRDSNTTGDGDNVVVSGLLVGNAGEPVTLKFELWSKEKDPKNNLRGAYPADQRNNKNPFEETRPARLCEPGDERFSHQVVVPLRRADSALAEQDGTLEFEWLWQLETP